MKKKRSSWKGIFLFVLTLLVLGLIAGVPITAAPQGGTFYVATDGNDTIGDGSLANPWATITYALDNIPDGSTILVRLGLYQGRIHIRGTFSQGVTIRSEVTYRAILENNVRVITAYSHPSGVQGITIEGFEIRHSGPES